MPTACLRALVVSVALVALPVLGLFTIGTAVAVGVPAVAGSPTATATPKPIIPLPTATRSATPSPTPVVTKAAMQSPTPSPTPRRTRSPRPTYSPQTQVTARATAGSTASPVPSTIELGPVPTVSPTKVPAKPAASSTNAGGKLAKLAALVVGAAVLLGLGGAAGLYLTRHRHE